MLNNPQQDFSLADMCFCLRDPENIPTYTPYWQIFPGAIPISSGFPFWEIKQKILSKSNTIQS